MYGMKYLVGIFKDDLVGVVMCVYTNIREQLKSVDQWGPEHFWSPLEWAPHHVEYLQCNPRGHAAACYASHALLSASLCVLWGLV